MRADGGPEDCKGCCKERGDKGYYARDCFKLQTLNSELSAAVNSCEEWVYDYDYAYKTLLEQFKTVSLDGFGCENMPLAISAAGAAIYYFKATQKSPLTHLYRISLLKSDDFMNLDFSTQRNLELTRRSYDGSKEGSLLGLLDLTV